jgi:hypothetical protein
MQGGRVAVSVDSASQGICSDLPINRPFSRPSLQQSRFFLTRGVRLSLHDLSGSPYRQDFRGMVDSASKDVNIPSRKSGRWS